MEGNLPARRVGAREFPSQEGCGRRISQPRGLGEGNSQARRAGGGEFPSQEGWGGELPSEEGAERIICIMYRGSGVKGVQNSNLEGMEAKSNQMAANGNQPKRSETIGNLRKRPETNVNGRFFAEIGCPGGDQGGP